MTKKEQVKKIAANQYKILYDAVFGILHGNKVKRPLAYMSLEDACDLINYYNTVLTGNYKQAYKIQINLDTCVREEIKDTVYNFVDDVNLMF